LSRGSCRDCSARQGVGRIEQRPRPRHQVLRDERDARARVVHAVTRFVEASRVQAALGLI